MTRELFEKVVAGLDATVIQEAVRQAREDGLSYEQFCLVLGTHAGGIPDVVLRRGYAAALMDEGISGVTLRQAQSLHDALMEDPELKRGFPQDASRTRPSIWLAAVSLASLRRDNILHAYPDRTVAVVLHRGRTMYTGFGQICRIDEDRNGLRVSLVEGPVGLLRNDHADFKGLRDLLLDLLHKSQPGGVPRLTWLAVDDDGVITQVRLVGKGIPLSTTCDNSGRYLIVFPFTNISLKLSPDHPRFREFEGYLLTALEHETPLYYVASAEDFYAIDDMLPVQPGRRPAQDGVAVAVATGSDSAEHGE